MFLIIICYPVSYFWYWWPMKSLIGMADPIHHLIIFAMWVMIWMKERSNIYAFAISMAGPHGFVKIIHMYLRTADVWICWFARFAFVKPSCLCICRQLISTLLLEQRWISPKTIFVFLKSNHLHFQTGDIHIWRSLFYFFTAHQSDRNSLIQPIFIQPFLQSDG